MKSAISPSGRYLINFVSAGEIKFGPVYFKLEIDGQVLKGRFFGDVAVWSSDSRYLAVQEWLTTDVQSGPYTSLTVFDMVDKKECQLSKLIYGWIIPMAFENSKVIYRKHQKDGLVNEFEIELTQVYRWKSIF